MARFFIATVDDPNADVELDVKDTLLDKGNKET